MTTSKHNAVILAVLLSAVVGCKSDDTIDQPEEKDSQSPSECKWDDDDSIETASDLTLGTEVEGFLCPVEDMDHYKFKVASEYDLLKVEITVGEEPISINPTYIIYSEDGSDVHAQPSSSESVGMNAPLSIVHPIEPKTYIIQVHDESKDATDNYHPYKLTLTGMADQDDNEPNDETADATEVSGTVEGYISYRGDKDIYAVTASDREILEVTLSVSDEKPIPSYSIEDANGNVVIERDNQDAISEVNFLEPLSTAGTYYLIVYYDEDGGLYHDPETPYSLTLSITPDPDNNEPNDVVADATPLSSSAVACGSEWVTMTNSGYIASTGDTDWFKVDLTGSDNAIVDVDVTFANAGSLPDDFQAEVRLVRPAESANTCTADQQCQVLEHMSTLEQNTCMEDIDCSRFGNTCLSNESLCAGANICLPNGVCGANLITRAAAVLETSDPEYDPGAPVSPESISVAAPLFGISTLYIAVNDHKNDTLAVEHEYTITVRVATDTDGNEPSEKYMNIPSLQDDESGPHLSEAKEVTVDTTCVGSPDSCCTDSQYWVTGAISYTFDQDWYRYEHPCPDADCMLRIHFEIESGPTDVLMAIYRGWSMWYDTVVYDPDDPISDIGNQPANNGVCGDNECLYAHHEDSDAYYFNVRDTIFVSTGDTNNGTWDWSREQTYRFCIAKYAEGCLEPPCHDWGEDNHGCGPPEEE